LAEGSDADRLRLTGARGFDQPQNELKTTSPADDPLLFAFVY
jgi:hypothetical protein